MITRKGRPSPRLKDRTEQVKEFRRDLQSRIEQENRARLNRKLQVPLHRLTR